MVDDQLREMYRHFVGQRLPAEIGHLLGEVGPYVPFESSPQSQQRYDAE